MSHSPKSWTLRLLGGAFGAVVLVAVLALCGVAGTVHWLYGYALPDSWRETVEREQARSRQMAATTQQKLTTGAADGSLTDEEIREAVGGPGWEMQRTDPVWLLRARFDGTEPICFSFEITTPLGPATRVTATELPTCPPDLP